MKRYLFRVERACESSNDTDDTGVGRGGLIWDLRSFRAAKRALVLMIAYRLVSAAFFCESCAE